MHIRRGVGWLSIIIGVLGSIFPVIPGLPFLLIGVHLVGHRDRKLRWLRTHIKLMLRHVSRSRIPAVRYTGKWARRIQYQTLKQMRQWREQHMHKKKTWLAHKPDA